MVRCKFPLYNNRTAAVHPVQSVWNTKSKMREEKQLKYNNEFYIKIINLHKKLHRMKKSKDISYCKEQTYLNDLNEKESPKLNNMIFSVLNKWLKNCYNRKLRHTYIVSITKYP
jgi:hypothetical protein